MQNLLILVQSSEDAANLTNAGNYLVAHGVRSAWVLISPQVLVSSEAASAQIDKEIAELRELESKAALAKRYGEAEAFSKQIDVKTLDKAAAISNAYTKLEAEDSKKRLQSLLGGIFEIVQKAGLNFKSQCAKEHYETGNFVNFLNAYLPARPSEFQPGNFGVVWASALGGGEIKMATPDRVQVTEKRSPGRPKFDPSQHRTLDQLEALAHFSLLAVAKHYQIEVPKGQPKEETIKQIYAKQVPVAA